MLGIEAFGAYIPLYRMKREQIAKAWGGAAAPGEKAVANFDEDAVTMAVAAGIDCLHKQDVKTVDACYFATTTAPYREKQAATVIAGALDMRRNITTIDFTDTLRSGTLALRAAMDAVKAGSAKKVLVVVADSRMGMPNSDFEAFVGDGAVAFLVGTDKPAAIMTGAHTHSDDILDVWRTDKDTSLHAHEDRFVVTQGYLANMKEGVKGLLASQKLGTKDISKLCLYSPDVRRLKEMAAELGIDYKKQMQDTLLEQVGNTGSALALMLLVAALEEAHPGDKLLVATYGDGCDAYVVEATADVAAGRGKLGIKGHLATKRYLANYEKYLKYRELIELDSPKRPPLISYPPVLRRDREWILGFKASRCKSCNRLFFPPQRICLYCGAIDEYEYVSLAKRQGTLYNFTKDFLAPTLDAPEVFTLVNLGDVRVWGRMTDRDPDNIVLEMPVEMTFRKLHNGGGYPNYFWKCMPLRAEAGRQGVE